MGKENKKPSGFAAYIAKMKAQNADLKDQLERITVTHQDVVRQCNDTIRKQALRIIDLQRELEIERQTLELRHQEIDGLYRRNLWQRVLNLPPQP